MYNFNRRITKLRPLGVGNSHGFNKKGVNERGTEPFLNTEVRDSWCTLAILVNQNILLLQLQIRNIATIV